MCVSNPRVRVQPHSPHSQVIKNQRAYYEQARVEIAILKLLNQRADPHDTHHIVRLLDYFAQHKHLCLTFELLSVNLYELIKHNQFRGLSFTLVRTFLQQVLSVVISVFSSWQESMFGG